MVILFTLLKNGYGIVAFLEDRSLGQSNLATEVGQSSLLVCQDLIKYQLYIQSKPWKMFAATLQPSWPSRPKTNVTLLFYFLKLYNFGLNGIFVRSTSSELQHPWISKITTEPKKKKKSKKIDFRAQFRSTSNQ